MSLKNTIQELFANPKNTIEVFYMSAKTLFIALAFSFFLCYFFVSANFYASLFLPFFLPLYVCFVLSFIAYICFFILRYGYGRTRFFILLLLCLFCFVGGLVFLLPVF